MIDNLQDIKEILQEEKKEEKNDKELYDNLVKYLYNIFNEEIRKDLLERGFIYFSYNKTRQEICNELAESQKEYNYYFMIYDKALKQVKKFFEGDIKELQNKEKIEKQIEKKQETQTIYITRKEKKEKRKIFGVSPIIIILFFPIILFYLALESAK